MKEEPTRQQKSLWDRAAVSLWHLTTGPQKRRLTWTPVAAVIFFGIMTGFIFLALWLDRLAGLPRFGGSWSLIVSIALFAAGLFVVGWTLFQFVKNHGTPVPVSPPQKLIISGLYAYVRNPMALGVFLLLEGTGFLLGSIFTIVIFAPLPVIIYGLLIKAVEEKELEMRFGEEYRQYKKRVPMFFPRFKK
jgi:protein-S-isoprenylcysteine O-methyltransferase Ste14